MRVSISIDCFDSIPDRIDYPEGMFHASKNIMNREATMKMVVAVIKHFKLDDVKEAVSKAGIHGMTVTEVKGFGRQKGHVEIYRGSSYEVRFIPKLKLEIAVPEGKLDEVVTCIREAAYTGEIGDGKIFISDLNDIVRIRTGERGDGAL
jgi:nitrogen regulatory protein P-II 2